MVQGSDVNRQRPKSIGRFMKKQKSSTCRSIMFASIGCSVTVTSVLSSKAPRPSAGKAFIDFYLEDESMKILAQSGEFAIARASTRRFRARRKYSTCKWKCSKRKRSRRGSGSSAESFCVESLLGLSVPYQRKSAIGL
jgi:hypothetical protein